MPVNKGIVIGNSDDRKRMRDNSSSEAQLPSDCSSVIISSSPIPEALNNMEIDIIHNSQNVGVTNDISSGINSGFTSTLSQQPFLLAGPDFQAY